MTRLGALAHPPFARLLAGQLVSSAGTQMSNTARAWVLSRLTHSALALGLQGLCFSAPIAVLPLLTGGRRLPPGRHHRQRGPAADPAHRAGRRPLTAREGKPLDASGYRSLGSGQGTGGARARARRAPAEEAL
jgi:hypothetical protein